jgi:tetratricopeptide (TPR) repeat protein
MYEDMTMRHHTITELRQLVAGQHYNIGLVHSAAENLDAALRSFQTALPIQEALARAYPTIVDYQIELSRNYFQVGFVYRRLSQSDLALSWYGKARSVQEAVYKAHPRLTSATESLAWTCNNLGYLQRATRRNTEALESYARAVHCRQQLVESDPSSFEWRRDLAWSHFVLSWLQLDVDDLPGAREAIDQSIAILESLCRERAGDSHLRQRLIQSLQAYARLSIRAHLFSDAVGVARRAASMSGEDYRLNPSMKLGRTNLPWSFIILGNAELAAGNPAATHQSYERARAFLESLRQPDQYELAYLAVAYSLLGSCPATGGPGATNGDAKRTALADRAVENLRRAIQAGYRDWTVFHLTADNFPLQPRGDFLAMFNDLVFPADPFAH